MSITGRWNRDLGHRLEIQYDSPACWAFCTCGYQGPIRQRTEEADEDAIAHELQVHARAREGKRFVRGRFE